MGLKILIVDLDPQGNATTGLGITKSQLKNSVYNVLIDEVPAHDAIIETVVENLEILPSDINLAGAEVELVYEKEREKALKRALQSLKNYDYIFIDCPPSLGLLTINALTASNGTIIPIQSEYYALEGLSQLMNNIKLVKRHLNPELQIEGVLLTMNDNRATMSKQIAQEVKKFFGKKLYDTVIPRNVKLAEAPSFGIPIMMHDTRSTGAKAYKTLAEEFYSKEKGEY
jgi:chromosome partitioning protein